MADWTLSVTELNEYVRRTLASDPLLRHLKLRGEISGYKRQSSGHIYFTLKDEGACIQVALFAQYARLLRVKLADGMQVILEGSVSLYPQMGRYQFYAEAVEPVGKGDLYLKFEALKGKLMAEGLFDASLKKQLPLLPKNVGIITSPTGAVVHDIQTVAARRHPGVQLTLYPVKVQGDGAAREIANAIREMDASGKYDVLIVGRGGGSIEDLWPFNEETVARAIFDCATPLVSAVGHEVDFTIADFAADVRAATPSVAAELVIPDRSALSSEIDALQTQLNCSLTRCLQDKRSSLNQLQSRLEARNPNNMLVLRQTQLGAACARLSSAMSNAIERDRQRLVRMTGELNALTPASRANLGRQRLNSLCARLDAVPEAMLAARKLELAHMDNILRALNPKNVMKRGFAIASDGRGVVSSVGQLQPGQELFVSFADGRAQTFVTDMEEYSNGRES